MRAEPRLRVRSTRRTGRTVVVSGTIAKASKARVRVALRCGSTTRRASVAPRKGRWSTKVALKGRCATAKTGRLGASVREQGRLGAQTVKTRTVKLG